MTGLVHCISGSCRVESSQSKKYLSDIICQDGKNQKNIDARDGKGFGAVNQIMNILDEVALSLFLF